uniref:Uncharacterized protein n=1 Tax=Kalanchoe fedtschenkoi TaxID=63787 RepID=A0A7N0TAP0_KALFE
MATLPDNFGFLALWAFVHADQFRDGGLCPVGPPPHSDSHTNFHKFLQGSSPNHI